MNCFIAFDQELQNSELPYFFTNPFNYQPHKLCEEASIILQKKLQLNNETRKGKMFGVLVVQQADNTLGFIAAYSGNEGDVISSFPFVPQVFNVTNPNGFFRMGEAELNAINRKVDDLIVSSELHSLRTGFEEKKASAAQQLRTVKENNKKAKQLRDERRRNATDDELKAIIRESQTEKSNLHKLKKQLKVECDVLNEQIAAVEKRVSALKALRKQKSAELQKKLLNHYVFANANGERKSAWDIFKEFNNTVPPAGTGDCAAPKLLQYAYLNKLRPIAMAEFWWGPSPKKEIRKHGYFYPACKSKCEPVLGHMLKGLEIEPEKENDSLELELLYEDESIVIVNKPSGLLSVPGKEMDDSVYTRLQKLYPEATGPMIVHRLDMATSGILVVTKTKGAHEQLQKQFRDKTVKKIYTALLDGIIDGEVGIIELPLRVDLDDRPRQLVDFEYGKPAITSWKVDQKTENYTRILFYPVTGRTHQLRIHAAHHDGLNTPIVGDELYGIKKERLLLHASHIEFKHPATDQIMSFDCPADF